ncbi:PQQ-binding-like beta-propeller repeat protein [Micromonospora sp. CPCC 206060]|uniref:outer membrane protein assembly factor BamB family protein n=1 Tax=Micromonospora sp. CPCC 206060 TaxID=3122406 RepID=UPI002FEFDA95
MGFPKGRRRVATLVVAVLAVGLAAVVGYRVLAPAEVVTVARTAYPAAPDLTPRVIGRQPTALLLVDGRLRVHAATRQVLADQPADLKNRTTPFWSYRRWPAELVGVVAVGTTVVSRWSDGRLVALDARTGRVAWRASGPDPDQGYAARRTGAAVAWTPAGLRTGVTTDGRLVLIVAAATELRGFDPGTGREVWRVGVRPGCHGDPLTTIGARLITVDTCATPQVAEFRDPATGAVVDRWRPEDAGSTLAVEGLGCAAYRSRCAGIRTADAAGLRTGEDGALRTADGAGRGWLVDTPQPFPTGALNPAEVVLADGTAVSRDGGAIVAHSARTGAEVWRRQETPGARILAAQPGRVHIRTEANDLLTVDPGSGAELSRFPFTVGRDATGWATGLVSATGGFLAVERLNQPVDPDAEDRRYYLTTEPVILAVI